MPKIELHVHLEGSVNPETLLKLAEKNNIPLPVSTLAEICEWYTFTDFDNFIDVYLKISECIQTAADLELIGREFLKNQKKQNIIYTEFTFTPHTHYIQKGISFSAQLAALERARIWGLSELGIDCRFIMDINRTEPSEAGEITANWLLENQDSSIVALGLGGQEEGYPPERHKAAFQKIIESRYHSIPHAGEMAGPASIRGALEILKAERLGHGVRSWEDPELIKYLIDNNICLEVCPSSNICLKVYPSLSEHVLPKLVAAGLKVTINSDDPPMFSTSLTDEYLRISQAFGFGKEDYLRFNLTAIENCFLAPEEKSALKIKYMNMWKKLN
ncbi:MAG: adenosine deaminase [Spirochaetales bacterium]|nr:adenosine deaminase [Spirochaetales bacterium]